ncbi:MAG: hypothetical protein A2Z15_07235 [Chloroflexi bacterium RBG_16_50_11]|nr:MAG: hypothetical protein A2Z15_07235 [Chloroflexi bacterium RBG_16_50_11]
MKQKNYIVVFITTKNADEAQKIAKALVKRRQAACVNIVPEVNSHFWWKDKLDATKESLLIVKTKESLLPEVIKSVKKIHSYTIPEIIALPIVGRLNVGKDVVLEMTQIGKECHAACAIRQQVGDCIMPREGIFARVIRGGRVKAGDTIKTTVKKK